MKFDDQCPVNIANALWELLNTHTKEDSHASKLQ